MSNNNGIITAPIDLDADVYKVLGISATSSGYDLGYACANTHGKINMWSKYKPVRYPKEGTLTEQEFKSAYYGIERKKVDTANLGCPNPFVYLPPTSGYPYRQDDFDRYNHKCTLPISITNLTEVYVDLANFYSIRIDEDVTSNTNNIKIKDIFAYEASWFPGVLVRNVNRNVAIFKTTAYALSSNENTFDLEVPLISSWTKGQSVDVYPVLSQTKYTGAADASPAIPDMYYLGSGNTGLTIKSSYVPGDGYAVIGNPIIKFNETYYMDEYHYYIYDIIFTLKNNGTNSNAQYVSCDITGDNGDNFVTDSISVGLTPGTQKQYAISCSIYLPTAYNDLMELIINVRRADGGGGGSVFLGTFEFETKSWIG